MYAMSDELFAEVEQFVEQQGEQLPESVREILARVINESDYLNAREM